MITYDNHLYHGSPFPDLKELQPRQAKDNDKANTFNNDFALFATDNVCMSIIFALLDRRNLRKQFGPLDFAVGSSDQNGEIEIFSEIPELIKSYMENAKGYVYILPKENFSETAGRQFKSKELIIPIDCYQATLEDYYKTGGTIEWTKNSL